MANPAIDTAPLLKAAKIFSEATRQKILAVAGKRMGVAAESFVPDDPPPSGKPLPKIYTRDTVAGKKVAPYKSKFKSDKQAYYVIFVLGKEGKIPYKRTLLLGRSITSAISDLTGSSVTVRTGTAVKYAPLVIGDDTQQSHYHKDHWYQLNKVMADNTPAIEAEGQKALTAGVEQELKGL